nr:hypothetical protein [Limosilactobacillus reuteri]
MDMGSNHIKAHAKQHKYLQENEPLIETLTDNKQEDNSVKLALKYAQEKAGLRTPQSWFKYNQTLRKSRRKSSYLEYILSVSGTFRTAKQRRLANPKTNKKTREKISREMNAILSNDGVPLDGSLYYISNTEIYDSMTTQQLKKYRHFEAETFRKFFNSQTFKELNPQNIRSEIHYDESGALHLQTQDVWFHKDKRGRLSYAKRAMIKDALTKKYGSTEALQDRLDVLCGYHRYVEKKGKQIGANRADTMFYDFIEKHPKGHMGNSSKVNKDGTKRRFAYSKAERTTRLVELWRIEQMRELGKIAEETAKSMNITYHVDRTYQTDGVHLDSAAYIEHKKVHKKLSQQVQQGQMVNDVAKSVMSDLKKSYKELTNKEITAKSPLEVAKKLKQATQATKNEVTTNQSTIETQQTTISRQNEQLKAQQQQLQAIQHQRKNEQAEIKELKKQKMDLQTEIKKLQQQAKNAGLIVSQWIRRNWQQLESHFRDYARDMSSAQNERLFGGNEGKGDPYNAQRYEKRAKEGLLASFEHLENEEVERSGLSNAIRKSINKQNDNNLER